MKIVLSPVDKLSGEELAAIRILTAAVFPPNIASNRPGSEIEYSSPQLVVIVWNDDQSQALSHAGVFLRQGRHNEQDVKIGGIGGVMTHPAHRNQKYATAIVARCIEFFQEENDVEVGLLVCKTELIPFYAQMGWREFCGDLRVTQKGKSETFSLRRTMTFPIRRQDQMTGTIDLIGPPW